MTAPELLPVVAPTPHPRPAGLPPPVRERTRREATRRRHARNRYRRYAPLVQILGVLSVAVAMVMVYLALMANLTGLTDRISRANAERAALQEETMRLDDRIAQLQSRERLATIATRLGMGEPHVYAVVTLPPVPPPAHHASPGEALLNTVSGWLQTR